MLEAVSILVTRLEEGFRQALERAQAQGELAPAASPTRLAGAITTTCQGIGLLSRLPGSRDRIQDAVATLREALQASTR